MDLDLRKAILHNIKNNTEDDLEATIVDAIQLGEEKTLPGLGYLFELIWKNSDESVRTELISILAKGVKQEAM